MNSPNRNLAIIKAVREQHQPVARVATRFNVSRQWVYALLRREGVRKFVCEALI